MKKFLLLSLMIISLLSSCNDSEVTRMNNIKRVYKNSIVYSCNNARWSYVVVDTTNYNVYEVSCCNQTNDDISGVQYLFNIKKL